MKILNENKTNFFHDTFSKRLIKDNKIKLLCYEIRAESCLKLVEQSEPNFNLIKRISRCEIKMLRFLCKLRLFLMLLQMKYKSLSYY